MRSSDLFEKDRVYNVMALNNPNIKVLSISVILQFPHARQVRAACREMVGSRILERTGTLDMIIG